MKTEACGLKQRAILIFSVDLCLLSLLVLYKIFFRNPKRSITFNILFVHNSVGLYVYVTIIRVKSNVFTGVMDFVIKLNITIK